MYMSIICLYNIKEAFIKQAKWFSYPHENDGLFLLHREILNMSKTSITTDIGS